MCGFLDSGFLSLTCSSLTAVARLPMEWDMPNNKKDWRERYTRGGVTLELEQAQTKQVSMNEVCECVCE